MSRNTHIARWKEGGLVYDTKCLYCNRSISVKRQNQKYCNKSHKQMFYLKRKKAIQAGKQKRIDLFQARVDKISVEIKRLFKLKCYDELDKLQKQKEELITIINNLKQ